MILVCFCNNRSEVLKAYPHHTVQFLKPSHRSGFFCEFLTFNHPTVRILLQQLPCDLPNLVCDLNSTLMTSFWVFNYYANFGGSEWLRWRLNSPNLKVSTNILIAALTDILSQHSLSIDRHPSLFWVHTFMLELSQISYAWQVFEDEVFSLLRKRVYTAYIRMFST